MAKVVDLSGLLDQAVDQIAAVQLSREERARLRLCLAYPSPEMEKVLGEAEQLLSCALSRAACEVLNQSLSGHGDEKV